MSLGLSVVLFVLSSVVVFVVGRLSVRRPPPPPLPRPSRLDIKTFEAVASRIPGFGPSDSRSLFVLNAYQGGENTVLEDAEDERKELERMRFGAEREIETLRSQIAVQAELVSEFSARDTEVARLAEIVAAANSAS